MSTALHSVDITTDGSGDASAIANVGSGVLMQLRYVPDGSSPLDVGANVTITDNQGFQVYSQTSIGGTAFQKLPRHLIANAADGVNSSTIFDYMAVQSPLTVTIDSGGNTLSGTFYLWVRD